MKSIALCETGAQINGKMEEEKAKDEAEMSEVLKKPVDGNGWQENSVITSTTAEILENGECVSASRETFHLVKKELSNGDLKCLKSEPVDLVNDTSLRTEQVVNSVNSAENANDAKEEAARTACDSPGVKKEIKDDRIENGTKSETVEQEIDDLPNEPVPKKEGDLVPDEVENPEGITGAIPEDSAAAETVDNSESVSSTADEVFDQEGNKENEELESDATNEVFTVDDEEGDKESNENDFSIQVGECQSVPIQDEDVSWGELQQAETSQEQQQEQEEESKELKVSDVKTEDIVPTEFKSELDVEKSEKKDISLEEEKAAAEEIYPYDECEEAQKPEPEPEIEDELSEDQMEEELVSEAQEDEDSALAIQIDEDPITEVKTDDEFATEIASEGTVNEERSRKRSVSQEPEDSAAEIKRRKTNDESVSFVDSADEEADDPVAFSDPPTPSEDSNSQVDLEEKPKKRTLDVGIDESENDQKKLKLESEEHETEDETLTKKKTNLEETIDMVATNTKPLPFLENLRGTLKNLTRSDLEELIVQKLCEVITERSTVGELRRRAQALEQDQEKWKEKVQSLTKQLRESEMVMKKFMSEVQKQSKDKNFQLVTPIRVTRSVGLQVSFLSNAGKMTRVLPTGQNQAMVNISSQQISKQVTKVPLTKQPLQANVANFNVIAQNIRKPPPAPTTVARTILSPQKNIVTVKKPIMQKPGTNLIAQNRQIAPQPLVNNNRVQQQNQVQGIRPAFKIATPQQQHQLQLQQQQQQQQPQQQQQQQQQPQQTGSRVIDLTDDDDKQAAQKALQASPAMRGQVRVVNHLQQSPVNQNSRVFHLVPATTATTGAGTQNRQIVIAASPIPPQNRQLVSSMPPLIFKGGNFVPAGPQATLVNQNVRPLAPKQFRHPAPLPQPPMAQVHRPNWKLLPPKPTLKISRVQTGIVLSWNMNLGPEYEPIASYQLYAYQESNTPPATSLWKKVGDVKALPLPMACTLTQFMTGHKYHFAVRAVDVHSRLGPFSASNFISL